MSDDTYFEKMADIALQDADNLDADQLKRQVKLVMKEVARDVRHKAVEMAYDNANKLNNMQLSN